MVSKQKALEINRYLEPLFENVELSTFKGYYDQTVALRVPIAVKYVLIARWLMNDALKDGTVDYRIVSTCIDRMRKWRSQGEISSAIVRQRLIDASKIYGFSRESERNKTKRELTVTDICVGEQSVSDCKTAIDREDIFDEIIEESRRLDTELDETTSVGQQSQITTLIKTNSKLRKQITDIANLNEVVDVVLRDCFSTIDARRYDNYTSYSEVLSPVDDEDEVMMVDIGDMHYGAALEPEEVDGMNVYNVDICRKRLFTLRDSIIEIVEDRRRSTGVQDLYVNFLGDIVDGECIFKGQEFEIDVYGLEQIMEGADILAQFLAELSCYFREIKVRAVMGNHGRGGPKGQHSTTMNWDLFVYRIMKYGLKEFSNIEYHISKFAYMLYEATPGFIHAVLHGDPIQGYKGLPYYGIDRATYKINTATEQNIKAFHIGHFHTTARLSPDRDIFLNGSFVGTGKLAANKMFLGSPPKQWCMGIHPTKGITWTQPIALEPKYQYELGPNSIYMGPFTDKRNPMGLTEYLGI